MSHKKGSAVRLLAYPFSFGEFPASFSVDGPGKRKHARYLNNLEASSEFHTLRGILRNITTPWYSRKIGEGCRKSNMMQLHATITKLSWAFFSPYCCVLQCSSLSASKNSFHGQGLQFD
jgi:hypothetical protein